jgi:exopolysaccharide biosynthesis polyprenyl glycosylphosphotransferase
MALTLALLEGGSLLVAVGATIFLWLRPLLTEWIGVGTFLSQAFGLSFCCIVAFYYNDLYDFRVTRNFAQFASRLVQSFGVAFILLAIFYTLFPRTRIAGPPLIGSFLTIIGLLVPLRAISYAILRSHPFIERVLILGASPLALKLVQEIDVQPHRRYMVAAVVDDVKPSNAFPARIPFRGPLKRVDKIIDELRPHRVILALSERRGQLPFRQLLEARVRGIPVEDGAAIYERLTGKLAIESLTPSYLIFSEDFKKSRLELAVSRALSLLFSGVVLVTLAPVLGLVALAIKLDSRGPVFIVQNRIGTYGKPFKLVKFRTMHPAADESSMWFQDNHARVTRVGRWLRTFRVDEIPQCLSILRGDLNLVGPRPHRASKFESFAAQIPYFSLRAMVPPGLTGWAQVRHGYASSLDEEIEKVRYDLYYIKHLSLWLDLRILFDTIKIVVSGRGSAVALPERAPVLDPRPSDVRAVSPSAVGRLTSQ